MSKFTNYILETEKKKDSKKEEKKEKKVKMEVSIESQGNIEAYNVMRAFAMGMENNLSSITVLKSHPTPEIAQGATVLEKDIRNVIQSIMNMQIPL